MKKLNVLQAKWSAAIRAELPAAKNDVLKATSLAAQKNPRLRAHLLAAANPSKKQRVVDDEDIEDVEEEGIEGDPEFLDDEIEAVPAKKRKGKLKPVTARRITGR